MNAASSLARKTAAAADLRGPPDAAQRMDRVGGVRVALAEVRAAAQHRRVDAPGRDRVDAHAAAAVDDGELPRQTQDAGLGRDVAEWPRWQRAAVLRHPLVGQRDERPCRGGVHDRAATLHGEQRRAVPQPVVDAFEVDRDRPRPVGAAAPDRGVVHQHIEPPEALNGLGQHRLDLGLAGDVGTTCGGAAAGGLDARDRFSETVLVDVGAEHGSAFRGAALRHRPPGAGGGAGNDGDPALEALCHGAKPAQPARGRPRTRRSAR